MWVRLTFGKVQPGKEDEFRKIYYEELVPVAKTQKGCLDAFLLESTEEDGSFISHTAWETKTEGEAYESSGTYKQLVGKVSHLLTESPTLNVYQVKK